MRYFKIWYGWLLLLATQYIGGLPVSRYTRTAEVGKGISVSAPLLGDEIDLETIEGIHQLTKLVLLKTDSLPDEFDEKIDGRYLNSLMGTLYTGLRKPFKSVSADILGIFPSFEEVQVRCDKTSLNEIPDKNKLIGIRRRSPNELTDDPAESVKRGREAVGGPAIDDHLNNETIVGEGDINHAYKSPTHICKAVTSDCLSMDDLVRILPPSITTFDTALVRLCPVMLFRIMNHLCHKPSDSLYARHDTELISTTGKIKDDVETIGRLGDNSSVNLNTLQILRNLQNSDELNNKRPQKLHKKLKTQTNYKSNGHMTSGNLKQHGVDEQLLKIRLKLSEPSIEKVWIFSLLFVILSIVVSMGGLIVLPFVRKTTRRRILTLFEGLAVGGLAGSATLHMFPQAFGLVDENYHRYFWRIFVVFLGIYLCYLCERMIKILKVVRTKMRRRSRASLIDMDYRYGFPSVGREMSKDGSMTNRLASQDFDRFNSNQDERKMKLRRKKTSVISQDSSYNDQSSRRYVNAREKSEKKLRGNDIDSASEKGNRKEKRRRSSKSDCRKPIEDGWNCSHKMNKSANSACETESPEPEITELTNPTRQRLIRCLKSVHSQFSPVYAVHNNVNDGIQKEGEKAIRLSRNQNFPSSDDYWSGSRKNRLFENHLFFSKAQEGLRSSTKRQMKQKEIETMLYHRNLMEQQNCEQPNLERGYLQQRLSSVKDVAGERQDQDNAARMSVDTVAWMIVFGDAVLNVIDGLSIGAAFERNILAGISISVAVMLEEVTHRLGTFAVLIRAGMSMQQSLLCTFLSACALFPGLVVGILLSDATEDATPYIFCAAGGIFLYMALVDVMKEMNRSIENAIRKDIKSTLQIFALQNVGIVLAVIFLSFLALYEQAMDFEEYQMQYNQPS